RRDLPPFEAGLTAPFSALLAVPLSHLGNLADGPREDRRLVLLPDGPIHGLPLAALRDPATKRFLIQELPVSVAASATLYVLSLARDKALPPARVPKVLLVGAPAVDATSELTRDLPPLAHAGTEIKGIAALYAPRPGEACTGRVKPLTGTGATVPAFLEEVRDSTVVHLAGHAIADPKAPHRSALVLARSPHQPGVLYAEELLGKLKLDRTRIVVLSACSTSGGHPVGPEGLAALVRPFIAAGAPAVVGSLWDVEDAPTEDLLVSFHRHYKEGHDAAVALRLAQLDLINNKGAGLQSVLAWAPFQVIGHASPPCSQTTPHPRRISP
ncbi:MAG TPA: CHAT domain-containing protein, partial [Thermoanaerobaculia bacterium]|nr:CHAT domain-containing protein [Thermoanaerobaculia bacterium]